MPNGTSAAVTPVTGEVEVLMGQAFAAQVADAPAPVRGSTLEQVQDGCTALNAALEGAGHPYRLWAADPASLRAAPKNARFMRQETFARLVENIKQDGQLESLPLCWRDAEGVDWLISGHHRTDAAKVAGMLWVLYLFTDREMTDGQRIAKQLAHNALAGEDSVAVLKELYEALPTFEDRRYSGVDEIAVGGLADAVPSSFQDAQVAFEEISLLFLSHEREEWDRVIEAVKERSSVPIYVASLQQWEGFFEQLLRFKETANIINTATALNAMVAIVKEWLDNEQQRREAEAVGTAAG